MSLIPERAEDLAPPVSADRRRTAWGWLFGVCFVLFTYSIGAFLVVAPWMDNWNSNDIQGLVPGLGHVWKDPYFRGAVTGLGLVNIYLACLEVVQLLRRS
jgi:hypothetical protein